MFYLHTTLKLTPVKFLNLANAVHIAVSLFTRSSAVALALRKAVEENIPRQKHGPRVQFHNFMNRSFSEQANIQFLQQYTPP